MTNLAEAIAWKWGHIADCDLDSGEITSWRHQSLPEPDGAEIKTLLAEYQAHLDSLAYRTKRKSEYLRDLPAAPSDDPIDALGDVLDDVIREVKAIRDGAPSTPQFDALLAKVATIKARHPRVSE